MTGPEIPAVAHFTLPEPAYELWRKGELLQALGIKDDGRTRVEIIGGEIVVSPAPRYDHQGILFDIQRVFNRREFENPDYRWRTITGDFDLKHAVEGYVPELIVLDVEELNALRTTHAQVSTAGQVALMVEVTSKSNAADDRMPGPKRERPTKWVGYARAGVEFYLLVDRDPRDARILLYTEPDLAAGTYGNELEWKFGQTVTLPAPFDIEIRTDGWEPWED